jgi:hypothetical protein
MTVRATLVAPLLLAFAVPLPAMADTPLTSTFTYQGQLKSGGSPVNGSYNLEFRMFDAASVGNQIGGPVTANGTTVTNGLFTVQLNLNNEFGGSAFNGSRRWLQIAVNGTTLSPRQELTPAPFAMYALAGPVTGSPWQLNGTNTFYNAGNVGIGTSSPAGKLDVAAGDNSYFRIDGSWGDVHFNGGNDGKMGLFNDSTAAGATIELHTSAGRAMMISKDRKIGINADPTTTGQLTIQPSDGGALYAWTMLGSQPLILAEDFEFFGNHGTANCIVGNADAGYGVKGESQLNDGVQGTAHASNRSGVWGNNVGAGTGVAGSSNSGTGTSGNSNTGHGVRGESQSNDGVHGLAHASNKSGVWGHNDSSGFGVAGSSVSGEGVLGTSQTGNGVHGVSNSTSFNVAGVLGEANGNGQVIGVYGLASTGTTAAGVVGVGATGGYFASNGLGANTALWANGLCKVGTLQILGGADLAEPFNVSGEVVQPGMVVVIDPDCSGGLKPCTQAYDRKVAGIISGAGGVATGLSMGHEGTLATGKHPVALSGRVYCLGDASNGDIRPGDLLTSSTIPGHAMKAVDFDRSRGAIIGKAMTSLKQGRGLVLVLVNLQ